MAIEPFTATRVKGAILRARRYVRAEERRRARQASRAILTAAIAVLGGPPPSSPGQPPARLTGAVQGAWYTRLRGPNPGIDVPADFWWLRALEGGHGGPRGKLRVRVGPELAAPRPFTTAIKARAWPEVRAIFTRAYMSNYRGGQP